MGLSRADERRLAFEPYLRQLADAMRLRDWTVEIEPEEPEDPNEQAHVVCIYGRKCARVRLSDGFLTDAPEEQRQGLVHELIHCHFDMANQTALEAMPEPVQDVYRRLVEYGVDGLADAIAPLLPLPLGPFVAEGLQEPPRAIGTDGTGKTLAKAPGRIPKL